MWDFLIGILATSSDIMMGFHLEPIKYYYDEAPTLFRSSVTWLNILTLLVHVAKEPQFAGVQLNQKGLDVFQCVELSCWDELWIFCESRTQDTIASVSTVFDQHPGQ